MSQSSHLDESAIKKLKTESKNGDNSSSSNLNDFQYGRILSERGLKKLVFVHGTKMDENGETKNAVIILEKPHFTENEIKAIIEENFHTDVALSNDIYTKMAVYPTRPFNSVQVQLVYPATEWHLKKYSDQEMFLITETYVNYLNLSKQVVEKQASNIQWVHNILEHITESERIIYEDSDAQNGFILLPDMKWDGQTDNFYFLAIIHRRDVKSIRDLNESHLDLLENLFEKSLKVIKEKYDIDKSKLRVFFHYQPSFYHLHVHFAHIKCEAADINSPRAHLLQHVIGNIKLCSDYYQKVPLSFMIRKDDAFYKLYEPFI